MPDSEALTALRWLSNRGSYLAVHGRRDLAALTPTQAHISGLHSVVQTEVGRAIPFSGHHLCSTHSLAEVSGAAQQMDGVFFGPILTTPSKVGFVETHGFGELAKACALGIPVIAIGGFQTPKDVAHCAELGAHGVAVLRAARKPSLLAELSQAFAEARP
ncbi:MAG: thiamine phosphate synthase, partial [Planctomycetes bacterium]|nr:thiamine phosphate synthase [Planctomycetota bacterium]